MDGNTIASIAFLTFIAAVNSQCDICTYFNQNACCSTTGQQRCCGMGTRQGTCPARDNNFSIGCRYRCIADDQCPPGEKCCPPNEKVCIPNAQLMRPMSPTPRRNEGSTRETNFEVTREAAAEVTTETAAVTTEAAAEVTTELAETAGTTVGGRRRRQVEVERNTTECPAAIAQATAQVLNRCNINGRCSNGFTCCPAPVQQGCCVSVGG